MTYVIAAMMIHEGGHFLAALAFGRVIKFRFALGWIGGIIPVPRGVWDMPEMELWKQRVVAAAGFGAEFAAALALPKLYLLAAAAHLALYPWYAGEANDFLWFFRRSAG